jgi:GH15 family glucan-1,4-alpha-glucosidase
MQKTRKSHRNATEPSKNGRPEAPEQLKIADHAVIGNLSTVALVGTNGVIDFMCTPRFDSQTVFAGLLDAKKGGYFKISPVDEKTNRRQLYLPDTNILITRFLSAEGVAEICDFMPIAEDEEPMRLIRNVKVLRGKVDMHFACEPHFDYGRAKTTAEQADGHILFTAQGDQMCLRLVCPVDCHLDGNNASGSFTLSAGEEVDFILDDDTNVEISEVDVKGLFDKTVDFWRRWSAKSQYHGRWREMVTRSALVLKLLTSKKYGSIVAAATFGLPEDPGGERNWDYRYTWIRDASFTIYALMRLGFVDEANDFMHWVEQRATSCDFDGSLSIMYRIDGSENLEEKELTNLKGFENSRPVRIGNAAFKQLQLDIYGEMLDALYLSNKYGDAVSYDAWLNIIRTIEYVSKNWKKPDNGIWEVRGGKKHFLHSRLMCWVAVDRSLRLATKRSLIAPLDEWVKLRNDIHQSIYDDFWNDKKKCFVQAKENDEIDASLLLLPLMKFISPTDPRWLSTLDRISKVLVADTLVYRYRPETDGLKGGEGSFTTCSFWYVECLARAGRLDEAQLLFEKLLSYANHLGLYSEELGLSGEHLGNFPQALTHLALISAAYSINRELSNAKRGAWER